MGRSAFSSLRVAFFLSTAVLVGAAHPAGAQAAIGFADPQARFVGAWPYGPAGPVALDTARDLAFYGTGGVVVAVDVTNPAAPALVSDAIQTRGVVAGLALDAGAMRLYVAAGEGGLEIWDVQSPGAPRKVAALGLTYFGVDVSAGDVVASGDFAYVSTGFGYLHQVDVSDPANPVDVAFYAQAGNPSGEVFLADGYVVLGGRMLARFRIKPTGDLSLVGLNPYTSAGGVFASGNYIYGTSFGDILIFDATQSTLPIVGSYPFGNAIDVFVTGSTAYVADATGGIRVLDVSDPANPVEIGADSTVGTVAVEAAGGYLYATGSNLFRVLDISVPSLPTEMGFRATESVAYDVNVAGPYAYLADASAGLYVLDVSDPANPAPVGHADVPGVALDVALSGRYAFLAAQHAGLRIFDVADPAHPAEIGAQATPDYARGVFVRGATAYVADLTAGLRVIDVSNPVSPRELGSAALPPFANHVFVQGDFAYVANGSAGLSVVDVSDPAAPTFVGSIGSSSYTADVFLSGDRGYIADFSGGLRILDLSDPGNPAEVGAYAPRGIIAGSVYVSGDRAFVMDAGENLRVVDVSNPADPVEVDVYDTPGDGLSVFVAGGDIFVADGAAGLQVAGWVGRPWPRSRSRR